MEAILRLFSPAFLSFFQGASEHTAFANQIRSGIEVVITGLIRNQFEGNLTWVRIPPAPPNASFHAVLSLGSWRFLLIGSRSAHLSGHSPSHLPRTIWSCSPDGRIHWLWSRNRCGQATLGSVSSGRRWRAAETRSYAGDRGNGYAVAHSCPAALEMRR